MVTIEKNNADLSWDLSPNVYTESVSHAHIFINTAWLRAVQTHTLDGRASDRAVQPTPGRAIRQYPRRIVEAGCRKCHSHCKSS